MLVIHWAKHNNTSRILKNGIRLENCWPASNRGVFVYPYSANATLNGTWRRTLKGCRHRSGNYNGFVFRLMPSDFPLTAGHWLGTTFVPDETRFQTPSDFARLYGFFWHGEPVNAQATELWKPLDELRKGFEIIIPHWIAPSRILRVLRDRQPRKASREKFFRSKAADLV